MKKSNRFCFLLIAFLFGFHNFAFSNSYAGGKSNFNNYPLLHQIHTRIRIQTRDIKLGLKNHSITKITAKNIKLSLLQVKKQELAYLKLNGNQDLNSAQQDQLNQLLNKNSSQLGETSSSINQP